MLLMRVDAMQTANAGKVASVTPFMARADGGDTAAGYHDALMLICRFFAALIYDLRFACRAAAVTLILRCFSASCYACRYCHTALTLRHAADATAISSS